MRFLPDSLDIRLTLSALILSVITLGITMVVAVVLARQEGRKELELDMRRTASAVIERLAEFVAPLASDEMDNSAMSSEDHLEDIEDKDIENIVAGMLHHYMVGQGGLGSLRNATELTCILADEQLLWRSTETETRAKECEDILPLDGSCILTFPATLGNQLVASSSCLIENDKGFELRRKVYLPPTHTWTLRVFSNRAIYSDIVHQRLLESSRILAFPVLAIALGGCLIWLFLRHQLKPIRQLGEQLLLGAPEESRRESQLVAPRLPEVKSIYDSIARSRTELLLSRQHVLSFALDLARSMQRVVGELDRVRDKAGTGEPLTDGDADDMQSVCSRARGHIDGYLARLVALDAQRLSSGNQETATHIDVCSVIQQEIDNVAWAAGDKDVDFRKNNDAVWLSGKEVAKRPFQTIMFELIERAFQYSRHTVKICVEQTSDRVRITIEDDNHSLPKARREKLLAWGLRADITAQNKGGDADLVAIQRLLTAMRGEVWSQNSELGGVRFVVELPADRNEEEAS